MCSLDLEECEVWREQPRVARKKHECHACGTLIHPGDAYLDHAHVFEGNAGSEKMCFPCWWVREVFDLAHGQSVMPSNLRQSLWDCIGDGGDDWRPELASVLRRYRTSPAWRRALSRSREVRS